MNLPDYQFIPAPLWILTGLHLLTLTLHFVAMGALAGGTAVLLGWTLKGRGHAPAGRRLAKALPMAMAATVTLGVAPLLFAQLVYHRQIYAASVASAWPWLLILAAAVLAYYLLYASALAPETSHRPRIYLAGAVVVFLYVSFVYSATFALAERPEAYAALYASTASGLTLNHDVGEYLFRWGHMIFGALTVGAFFAAALARGDEVALGSAKRWMIVSVVGATVVGLAYLQRLGPDLAPFLGGTGLYAILASIALTALALWAFFTGRLVVSGGLLTLSVAGMAVARHTLRLVRLGEAGFEPTSLHVHPQWGVFAVFSVSLVLALAVVAWMIRALVRGGGEAAPQ